MQKRRQPVRAQKSTEPFFTARTIRPNTSNWTAICMHETRETGKRAGSQDGVGAGGAGGGRAVAHLV